MLSRKPKIYGGFICQRNKIKTNKTNGNKSKNKTNGN